MNNSKKRVNFALVVRKKKIVVQNHYFSYYLRPKLIITFNLKIVFLLKN